MTDIASTAETADCRAAHIFTVDVEEYFQAEAFSAYLNRDGWFLYPNRVEANTEKLLELLAARRTRGTFFVLGSLAARHPRLVRAIGDRGHEIASHGHDHVMLTHMTPSRIREDVRRAKRTLEDITGNAVIGYRAPTFSIVAKTAWSHDVLLREGYLYSSSVFPVRHDRYGWPEFGTEPRLAAGTGDSGIWEVPLSVVRLGPVTVPFGGGGYLRLYPLALTRFLLRSLENRGRPGVVYIHPWELDEDHPRVKVPFLTRVRHYHGIPGMKGKIEILLKRFRFDTMARYLRLNGTGSAEENVA